MMPLSENTFGKRYMVIQLLLRSLVAFLILAEMWPPKPGPALFESFGLIKILASPLLITSLFI